MNFATHIKSLLIITFSPFRVIEEIENDISYC